MRVVEIFKSIDGEGKRVGLPVTFIRLYGCNLSCAYCDTVYGCTGNEFTVMSVDDIVNQVLELDIPYVTVTGGEPLIHEDINKLLKKLTDNNIEVNVETNGTVVPTIRNKNIFYTMDFKTNASGMSDKMNLKAIWSLTENDVLKFVVGNRQDLVQSTVVIDSLENKPQIYFSPVFGMIEPKEIVQFMLDTKSYDCRVQVQLHKVIWDPNERGV